MQTILVIGASSGIGLALCQRMATLDWQVFGAARRTAVGHPAVRAMRMDVQDDGSVREAVRAVLDAAGAIDVVVNAAGYLHEGPLEAVGLTGLQAIFDTNFFGTVRVLQEVLPHMRARRRGRIINVSSVAGLMPLPFYGAYCASKHALESYSESLRYEVAPLGIDVSLVEPGFNRTNMAASKVRTPAESEDYSPQQGRMFDALDREEASAPPPDAVVNLLVRLVANPRRNRLRYVLGPDRWNYRARGIAPEWLWEAGLRRHWRLDS